MNLGDVGVYYAKKEATALLSGRVSFPKQLTASAEYAAVTSRISTGYRAMRYHGGVQYVERSTDGKDAKFYLYLFVDHGFGNYEIIAKLDYAKQDELIYRLRGLIKNGRSAGAVSASSSELRTFYGDADSGRNSYQDGGIKDADGKENPAGRGSRSGDNRRSGAADPYGSDERGYRSESSKEGIKKKPSPTSRGLSNRQLLVDAFEELIQSPKERELIEEYRSNISKVEDVQERLRKLRGEIRRLTNAGGDRR